MQAVLKQLSLALRINNKGGVSPKLTRQPLTDFLEVFSAQGVVACLVLRVMVIILGSHGVLPEASVSLTTVTKQRYTQGRGHLPCVRGLHLKLKEPEKEKRPVGQLTDQFGS